ncbi:MAG: hypothetical protein GF393_01420 [Armatimonadia bacterium]|nr:hypothetical protein [Armatimonadia bacterium]
MRPRWRLPRAGFTAEELIAVLGVVILLTLGFFWATRDVRETARMSSCASNLKQMHHATRMYMTENDGRMPTEDGGIVGVHAYVMNNQVFLCPTAEARAHREGVDRDTGEWGVDFDSDYQFAFWAEADHPAQTLIVRDDEPRHLGMTWLSARLDGAMERYPEDKFETAWELSRCEAEGTIPDGMPRSFLY